MAAVERYRGSLETDVLSTGRDLLAVKARAEHGLFLRWVRAEMGFLVRTAQRYMHAAAQLWLERESVAHLAPTGFHAIASPSRIAPQGDRGAYRDRQARRARGAGKATSLFRDYQ
ncbi:hypothetical protein [Methylobacterium durans]|uniref:DUF3102 domain-containing protein n=1 Tax=Methylobacterium durans TaxID=2202825 RepID=A0A2U8W848_9HYPH|nr:hypothetical protein [Methylobacterium durans]AWN42295.1 hypothetical protein DK389_19615 [Methylobacterium durans]